MSRELNLRSNSAMQHASESLQNSTWYVVAEKDAEAGNSLRKPVIAGTIAIVIGFGSFILWGFTANLDSAAIARGNVIVDSQRKTVSHLEGGIQKRLLVHEGEAVKKGQPLLELDDTRARAELQQLRGRRIGLLAKLARLRAEQAMAREVSFPKDLLDPGSSIASDLVSAESKLFERRRAVFEGKLAYKQKEIEQITAQIEALKAQIEANTQRQALVQERVEAMRGLEQKGFASKANLSELQLELSELIGDGGDLAAQKARGEQARQGAEVGILSIEQEWQSDIASEFLKSQLELNETNERIVSAKDVLDRLVVHAPQDGVVLNINTRTPGGVVEPGQPIMDIVPQDEKMLIEAKMNLRDIDAVRVGSETQVRLTAYDARSMLPLSGHVTYVAADQTIDPQAQVAYYIVRAEFDAGALAGRPLVSLYPGMPAELLIKQRERKAIDYLLEPITESFNRAFKED